MVDTTTLQPGQVDPMQDLLGTEPMPDLPKAAGFSLPTDTTAQRNAKAPEMAYIADDKGLEAEVLNNTPGTQDLVANEILTTGQSPTLLRAERDAKSRQMDDLRIELEALKAKVSADPSYMPDPDYLKSLAKKYKNATGETINLTMAASRAVAATAPNRKLTPQEDASDKLFKQGVLSEDQSVMALAGGTKYIKKGNEMVNAAKDLAAQITPIVGSAETIRDSYTLAKTASDVLGVKFSPSDLIHVSRGIAKMRTHLSTLQDPKEQKAFIDKAYKVFNDINKQYRVGGKDSVLTAQDFAQLLSENPTVHTLFGKTFTSDDIIDVAYGVGTLATTLELPLANRAIRRIAAYGADISDALRGKPMMRLDRNSLRLDPLGEADLVKPNNMAEALAKRTVDPRAAIAVKPTSFATSSAGASLQRAIDRLQGRMAKMQEVLSPPIFTQPEQDTLIAKVQSDLANMGASVRPDMSEVVAKDNTGFRMRTTFGHSDTSGFASMLNALDFADDHIKDVSKVHIFKADPLTKELTEIPSASYRDEIGLPGEYFVQVEDVYKFDPADKKFLGDGPVQLSAGGGTYSKWLLAPADKIRKDVMDAARVSFGNSQWLRKQLNDMIGGRFMRLPKSGMQKLSTVLHEGDTLGREFTVPELTAKGLDNIEQAAYYEARAYNKTLYEMANSDARTTLDRGGWGWVYNEDNSLNIIGKEAKDAEYAGVKVINPRTGAVYEGAALAEEVRKGSRVYKTKQMHQDASGGRWNFVLGDEKSTVDTLPHYVLNYNEGQITRIYDAPYFIRASEDMIIDGNVIPRSSNPDSGIWKAVATANTPREAQKYIDALKASGKYDDVNLTFSRDTKAQATLLEGPSQDFDFEGALLTSARRSEALPAAGGGPAKILDPIQAMNVARDVVSDRLAFRDFTASMKEAILKKFGKNVTEAKDGSLIVHGVSTDAGYKEAKIMVDWLETIHASDPTVARIQQRLLDVAEYIEGSDLVPFRTAIASRVGTMRVKDPVAFMRSAAFVHQVAVSGPRAAFMNVLQSLMLAGIAPVSTVRAIVYDSHILNLAMLYRDNPAIDDVLSSALLRAPTDLSKQEVKAAMEAYRMSGLPYSIDSHAFFRGENFAPEITTATPDSVRFAKDVLSSPFRLALGAFKLGEQMNYANTFMIALRRYKAKFPKADFASKDVWSEIAADARTLTLDMSPVNDLAYQRGILSIPMQYFAIVHKAATLMTFNKSLTPVEKARLALGSLVVYGAAGFPGGEELVEPLLQSAGINIAQLAQGDPAKQQDIKNTINGGFTDLFYNRMMQEMFDEERPPSVKAAESLSLVSGLNNMVKALLTGKSPEIMDAFAGPGGSLVSTYSDVIGEFALMARSKDMSDVNNQMHAMAVLPEVTSGWSRYAKAQLGLQLHASVSKRFTPVVRQTESELWSRGVFGFRSTREAEAYLLSQTKQQIDDQYKAQVDMIAKTVIRTYIAYADNPPEAQQKMLSDLNLILSAMGPEGEAMRTDVLDRVANTTTAKEFGIGTDKLDDVIESIMKGIYKGKVPSSNFSHVYNSQWFLEQPAETQEALRKELTQMQYDVMQRDLTIGAEQEQYRKENLK